MSHVEDPFASQMPSQSGQSAAPTAVQGPSGRSGRRSRTGCDTCKSRRVRCDEARPACRHCVRLQLDCNYHVRPRKKARVASVTHVVVGTSQGSGNDLADARADSVIPSDSRDRNTDILSGNHLYQGQSQHSHHEALNGLWQADAQFGNHSANHNSQRPSGGKIGDCAYDNDQRQDFNISSWKGGPFTFPSPNVDFFDFAANGAFDAPNAENSFGTFMFADTPWHTPPRTNNNLTIGSNRAIPVDKLSEPPEQPSQPCPSQNSSRGRPVQGPRQTLHRTYSHSQAIRNGSISVIETNVDRRNGQLEYLLSYFQQIVQPPAAILVGGVHKWRRLQSYFVRISEQSRAVASALFALIELLALDEAHSGQRNSMAQALERHESARKEIDFELSRVVDNDHKSRDQLLAAVFLLAWFEVIRDQVADQSLFPSDVADKILLSNSAWNSYSKQLLQWLNTLDSKATHLGGHNLLSPEALQVVSQHPTQISTSDGSDDEQADHETPEDAANSCSTASNEFSPAQTSHPHHHGLSPECSQPKGAAGPSLRQMKQIVVNTTLQPALSWYLESQSYCRRISSLDRHHRNRFTVKDEYEVITACKQLETELFKLWRQRPMVITLMSSQLSKIVSADMAARLEEIFSIYLASFWILFVFLHRVSWWNLPHSETAQGALEEAWKSMQRSYGEFVNGGQKKKVVHPALLWPLFLFGSECTSESRRNWAIDQLEALGEAKPVIGEDDDDDVLPPFRLSAGATRNGKRAALLLRELIKRQNEQGQRVDDRNLSVELFGCHFSII